MHGLLLIDKPAGVTSHDVVQRIRRLYATRKVGHAGTLDPLATGVLVVAVGDGTKILQFLFCDDKSYRAELKLGITTDTFDRLGQPLITRDVPPLSESLLEKACAGFRGISDQLPPMFSALKRNGIPLYKLARKGADVDRASRRITITRLDIVRFHSPDVTLEVDCSKGTYIRSLVYDLGERLGCGAHLTGLRRLRSGRFAIDQCHTLEQLERLDDPATALLPLTDALADYPALTVTAEGVAGLSFGIPPQVAQCRFQTAISDGDLVRFQADDRLLAIARYRPLREKEKRGDFELIRVLSAGISSE